MVNFFKFFQFACVQISFTIILTKQGAHEKDKVNKKESNLTEYENLFSPCKRFEELG